LPAGEEPLPKSYGLNDDQPSAALKDPLG
jgi:hypothetical protein